MTDSAVKLFDGNNDVLATDYDSGTGRHTLKTTGGGSGGTFSAAGPTAAGVALTANPVTIGGRAATALPTAVTDGQVVNAMLSKYGQQIVRQALRENQGNQYTTIANTTETTIITADAANKLDISALTFTSDTALSITIRDGTAGTIKDKFTLQANSTGGFVSSALPKLLQTAINANWTAQLSTNGNVTVSATYIKAGA